MKKIFISHPLRSDFELNRKRVNYICKKLVDTKNIIPISPLHLFKFYETEPEYSDELLEMCCKIISVCDGVYFYDYGKLSEGQTIEFNHAESLNILIEKREPPLICKEMKYLQLRSF